MNDRKNLPDVLPKDLRAEPELQRHGERQRLEAALREEGPLARPKLHHLVRTTQHKRCDEGHVGVHVAQAADALSRVDGAASGRRRLGVRGAKGGDNETRLRHMCIHDCSLARERSSRLPVCFRRHWCALFFLRSHDSFGGD